MAISSSGNNKKVPYHLAIIIDGNRRWAQKRNLPISAGHQKGLENVKRVGKWCKKRGIKILTLYAFSTENWHRSKKEVNALMKLLGNALDPKKSYLKRLHREGIRLRVIGQKERLQPKLQKLIQKAEKLTENNKEGILNLALSYGGRAEILEATKKIIKKKIPAEEVTEEIFEKHLWTGKLPPPDLIIRTSGEKRLSGFLLWQSAYSELYFTKVLWPDFQEKDLDKALRAFARRHRRFGH